MKKYGLTADEWIALATKQGNVCAICGKLPKSGRLHTDHFHLPGWKKLPPEERKKFVRGLACQLCNRFYLARGMTAEKARALVVYLDAFEVRS